MVTNQRFPGHTDIITFCKNFSDKLSKKWRVSHNVFYPSDVVIGEDHSYFITGHTQLEKTYFSAVSQGNLDEVCVCVCIYIGICNGKV